MLWNVSFGKNPWGNPAAFGMKRRRTIGIFRLDFGQ